MSQSLLLPLASLSTEVPFHVKPCFLIFPNFTSHYQLITYLFNSIKNLYNFAALFPALPRCQPRSFYPLSSFVCLSFNSRCNLCWNHCFIGIFMLFIILTANYCVSRFHSNQLSSISQWLMQFYSVLLWYVLLQMRMTLPILKCRIMAFDWGVEVTERYSIIAKCLDN